MTRQPPRSPRDEPLTNDNESRPRTVVRQRFVAAVAGGVRRGLINR